MMGYAAFIERVATGEMRRCYFPTREWDAVDADPTEGQDIESFIWEDGNDACDCNRSRYFTQAAGEDDTDRECGNARYRLDRIETDDGRVILRESAEIHA